MSSEHNEGEFVEVQRVGRIDAGPTEREQQMISLAYKVAEKQLQEGTASSQVITHFLKLATSREAMEREILSKQAELLGARTDALKSGKNQEQIIENAIQAMKHYGPRDQ